MKKALLAIISFITNASAYSWRWAFISAKRDSLKRQTIDCYYDFNQHKRVCFDD